MDETEDLRRARAMRRAMMGDEYVDAQVADPNPVLQEFQDHLTPAAKRALLDVRAERDGTGT